LLSSAILLITCYTKGQIYVELGSTEDGNEHSTCVKSSLTLHHTGLKLTKIYIYNKRLYLY